MAQLAPFGFQAGQSRRSVNEYYVPASDTSTLAVGDPVRTDGNVFVGRLPDSRVSKGMLHATKAAPGQAVRGVIVGIVAGPDANNLQSLPAVKTRPYCLLVNDNPQTLWDVQANNAAPLSAMAGMYTSYAVGDPLGSVSSTVVDSSTISATVGDLLIAEVLRNDGANSLLRVAFVQHEMAAAGGSPQIGAQIQSLVSGAGKALLVNRSRSRPCVLMPAIPSSVTTAFTGTHNLMMTAPGDFDAVALIAINIDASAQTIDACSVAVSERSDTSKTVPIIGGSNYNTAAAAGTQNGFIAVTWGGSASATVPAGTAALPGFLVSDFTPISSIARVDDPTKFPLVIARAYYNSRPVSGFVFASTAEVDNFNTLMAPYEFYQVAQVTVDGATPATAANFTSTWSAGASTSTMRLFGMAFRIRGTSDTVLVAGDSIVRGFMAAGNTVSNNAANYLSGWFATTMRALADKTRPIGFVNLGISGDTSTAYLARAKAAMTALRPSIAMYMPYTTNDAPTTAIVTTQQLSRALDFVDTCRTNDVAPVLMQAPPCNRPLALRLDLNTKVAAMSSLVSSVDLNTPLYDAANAANNYFITGTNYDDTHPNAAGHALLSASAVTQLRTLLDR